MICGATCFIAIIFLIANIYTILSTSRIDKEKFFNVLDNNQKKIYENIIIERRNIYYIGFILGIILSILFIFINKKIKLIKLTKPIMLCLVITITFITNYLFYILYPKSTYMLLHLHDKKQINEWLNIYKKMQYRYHFGFVLGIIAVFIFCLSIKSTN
jgi:fructose-specific phosphotransferase system IIC component